MSMKVAQQYLSFPHLEAELRADLEPIVKAAQAGDAKAAAEIEDRFFEPLAFGTGGLRGFMAAGLRRMNQPNVRRTTLALAAVALRHAPDKKIAVVGYDTRLRSDVFAAESAAVLAAAGYQVFLGTRPLPTPFLCFAMKALGSGCGVIITASHNPKEYNGYKAYNDRGGQVVDPWDAEVEAHMAALPMVPEPPVAPQGRISPIPVEIENAYLALGQDLLQHPQPFTPARILYTPFHGTGVAFVPALFELAGLPLTVSPSQGIQDGAFPTAPRPNPEELAAYAAPLKEAEAMEAEVILANDPDADRIGLVAKRNGAWELMSGNDLAALTLDYLCSQKGRKGAVVSTAVTSDFMAEVARHYGLPVVWTLTGFKNIAVCMDRLDDLREAYAFSAEESYGMLIPPSLRDKDGVTAALVVAELAGHCKA